MCIRDLNLEFEKLKSTDSIDSAQAAAATSHKYWCDTRSADVSVQKRLSNLLSSGRAQKENERLKANEAFQKYYEQGGPRNCDHYTELMKICQI
jgi:hypothetical protein